LAASEQVFSQLISLGDYFEKTNELGTADISQPHQRLFSDKWAESGASSTFILNNAVKNALGCLADSSHTWTKSLPGIDFRTRNPPPRLHPSQRAFFENCHDF